MGKKKNEGRKWDGRILSGQGKVEGKGQEEKIGMGKKKNKRRRMDRKLSRGDGRVGSGEGGVGSGGEGREMNRNREGRLNG